MTDRDKYRDKEREKERERQREIMILTVYRSEATRDR